MKNLILVTILMMTIGCGKQTKTIIIEGKPGKDGTNGKDGSSCSVARAYDASGEYSVGVRISCTDGSSELVLNGLDGQTGATGAQGIQGVPGSSCSVSRKAEDNYVTVSCPQQTDVVIYDGLQGQQGLKGDKGEDGKDGEKGDQGQAGSGVSVLYPCGKGTHTEIFLKLSTGEIVAVYDGGPNDDRLALLIQGVTYTTTDRDTKKNCLFKLDSNNNIIKL